MIQIKYFFFFSIFSFTTFVVRQFSCCCCCFEFTANDLQNTIKIQVYDLSKKKIRKIDGKKLQPNNETGDGGAQSVN